MTFVFDTNSFRVLGNYFPERFPSFWEKFQEAIDQGEVVSVREVFNELKFQVGHTWLWNWVRRRRSLFLTPTSQETDFVVQIFGVAHFRNLVGERQRLQGHPVADPFIVACAKVRQGCVVTEEAMKPHAAKIPNVCEHFGVEYVNVERFLERKGWRF